MNWEKNVISLNFIKSRNYDHKVLTEEEIADRREKCDEIAMKILEKLKLEENIS